MVKMEKLLKVKDLSVEYHTVDGTVQAVRNVSLNVEPGKVLGLVGETGAGKTTTVKTIIGILQQPPGRVTDGEILFLGEDLLKKNSKEMRAIQGGSISMIFQDPMTSLNPVLTVQDQIAETIRLHRHLKKREARTEALKMLEKVGIRAERGSEYPHQFSGGMKQRVIIAMALACNPKLLIADEPTTALDVTIQAQVLELIKELKEQYNTAMLLITHDLGIVAETCDDVAVMYAGQIVEYGTLEHIFKNAAHPYTIGLYNCIPDMYSECSELTPIHGLTPNPYHLPEGCSFHPRCPRACSMCADDIPLMTEIEPGHFVRCFFARDTKDNEKGEN
jgi:peptide/nickel transport system ATP-binding protein